MAERQETRAVQKATPARALVLHDGLKGAPCAGCDAGIERARQDERQLRRHLELPFAHQVEQSNACRLAQCVVRISRLQRGSQDAFQMRLHQARYDGDQRCHNQAGTRSHGQLMLFSAENQELRQERFRNGGVQVREASESADGLGSHGCGRLLIGRARGERRHVAHQLVRLQRFEQQQRLTLFRICKERIVLHVVILVEALPRQGHELRTRHARFRVGAETGSPQGCRKPNGLHQRCSFALGRARFHLHLCEWLCKRDFGSRIALCEENLQRWPGRPSTC
eukprot:scaffold6285_cov121-Isochrysis_galbana.AAC.13